MTTADFMTTLREVYTARFGPLLLTEAEYDPLETREQAGGEPADGGGGVRDDENAGERGRDDRYPDKELVLQIEANRARLAAMDVRGVHVSDVGPPWDLGSDSFPADDEEEGDDGFLCWRLTFGPMTIADPRSVEASYGACSRAGHEVFLASAVPFYGFGDLLGDILRKRTPLSAGMVLPTAVPDTPFTAVLLAPPGAGSIPLGAIDGVERFALKVVPLTAAEAALGARSVDHLVTALGAAGALEVTDPLRDCVLAPEATRRYWTIQRPALAAFLRSRLEMRLDRLKRQMVAGVARLIRENERRLVHEARLLLWHVDPGSRMLN